MRKGFVLLLAVMLLFSLSVPAWATNGDNLISIGPISRAMGGVGIAAPQDAISAVFSNPAAMCFGPYCPGSEFNFAGSIFMPDAKTKIRVDALGINVDESSDSDIFIIPALGISSPITQNLRFGLAAYGVSGLGVDYRDKFDLNPLAPGNQDVYTNLQIMKFAPNLAYLITPNLSLGAAIHVNYGSLDLDDGTSSGFGIAAQLGAIYKTGPLSFGLVYLTPSEIDHENVADFDGDGRNDDLELESPQTLGFGIAYEPSKSFLIEANAKWVNWADAKGYEDFDWDNQWVFNIGAQYRPMPKLALRVGYNYGENPVEEHDGWEGFLSAPVDVQGKNVNRFQYEVLRIAGFPAIVEHHITAGIGYQLTKSVSLDLGYMHAFQTTVEEKGTFFGAPAFVEASLSEDSIDFGITWRF
jgi:long-chain fatty acid transport protein